ncbi:MAG: DUF962 domain-containing protein [Acidobacteriaceae bacterium]
MLGGKTNEQWVAQYASSHRHPANRACHTVGIPMIAGSLAWGAAAVGMRWNWRYPAGLFIGGWVLHFVGHGFERKEPEFFHDWRFLLVGLRWWWAKMRGRA